MVSNAAKEQYGWFGDSSSLLSTQPDLIGEFNKDKL